MGSFISGVSSGADSLAGEPGVPDLAHVRAAAAAARMTRRPWPPAQIPEPGGPDGGTVGDPDHGERRRRARIALGERGFDIGRDGGRSLRYQRPVVQLGLAGGRAGQASGVLVLVLVLVLVRIYPERTERQRDCR